MTTVFSPSTTKHLLGCCGLTVLWTSVAVAQDGVSTDFLSRQSSIVDESIIDEVIVEGKRSPKQIRREIRAAETKVLSLFNDLNSDDDYDIICRRLARIGSQITRIECKARIYWDAESDIAQGELPSPHPFRPLRNPAKHVAIFREKMIEISEKEPSLRLALVELRKLTREYAAVKAD